ncbi:MAG: hypothetical protein P8171_17695 [Candidatus Thiodiazotropha sp.]|jgi:hypothetical protein
MNRKQIFLLLSIFSSLFCSSSSMAWLIEQSYDSQGLGDTCENWQTTKSYVTDIQSYSGSNSCLLHINAGQTGFGVWGGILSHPSPLYRGDEVWVRVRTFFPASFNYDSSGEGNHLKFLRLHTRGDSNTNYGYDDIYIDPEASSLAFRFIYEGDPVWSNIGSTDDKIKKGVWETYEYYVKFDSISKDNGGNAIVRFWKNGELLKEVTNLTTLANSNAYSESTYIFTYWNGASPQTQQMYLDDLVITSSPPGETDSHGNKYIGVSGGYIAVPKAPSPLYVQ